MKTVERLEEGVLYDAEELEGFELLNIFIEEDGQKIIELDVQRKRPQLSIGKGNDWSVANQIKKLRALKLRDNIAHVDHIYYKDTTEYGDEDKFGIPTIHRKLTSCLVRV
jgi:hypothetical protein